MKGAVTGCEYPPFRRIRLAKCDVRTKTFKIKPSGSRRSSDVLACYQYRYYTRFVSHNDCDYMPGVIFPTSSGDWIINYPKQHSENCTRKHHATSSWFKPMVRIMKNMRSRMVGDGIISD